MPQILAIFGYEIVGGITISAGTTVVATISYATLINAAIVAGSVAYSSAQNRKLQNQLKGLGADRGRDVMARDPLAYRRLIYGQIRTTGPVVYMATQGTKNEYLHLVIVLADHECDELGQITFDNDEEVPLDGSGNATGKYAGYVTIKKFVGTTTQAASSQLQAAFPGVWTADHTLSGIAYLHAKLKFSTDLFPNGIPTIKCLTRGKKIYDLRDGSQSSGTPSTWKWSCNSALCAADFIHDSKIGRGVAWTRIKSAELIEAANTSDEPIVRGDSFTLVCDMLSGNRHIGATPTGVLPGMRVGGTGIPSGTRIVSVDSGGEFFTVDKDPTATNAAVTLTFGDIEYRYETHGTVTTDQLLDAVTLELVGAMAGHAIDTGGLWTIRAGAYRTPTVDLTDNDLAGAFTVIPRLSRRETYNGVKGTYISPYNQWVASDFPSIKNDTYKGWDGGVRLWKDISLPFTTSPAMAQRLAKIDLERGRQQITVEATYKLKAFEVMPIDTVRVTRAELGWTNKEFEITNWKFIQIASDTGIGLGVTLSMRETASGVWDWADGEETTVDIAPNTNLPDPSDVPTPTGIVLASGDTNGLLQADGTWAPRMLVTWDSPNNIFVESGGKVRIEYKKSADADWIVWAEIRGDSEFDYITDVHVDEDYDVRIQFQNGLGVRGEYSTIETHTIVGKLVPPVNPSGFTAYSPDSTHSMPSKFFDVSGTKTQMFGCIVELAPSVAADADFCEYCGFSSSVTPPDSSVPSTTPNIFVEAAINRVWYVYSFTLIPFYLWVRTFDKSGNPSAWYYTGLNLNSYFRLPAGELAELDLTDIPDVVDATTYGAVGDGTTDDTAALQAFIDDAYTGNAETTPRGIVVKIPAGTFAFTTLVLKNGVVLEGAGEGITILKKTSTTGYGILFDNTSWTPTGVQDRGGVRNLSLWQTGTATAGAGIFFKGQSSFCGVRIENVRIQNCYRGLALYNTIGADLRNVQIFYSINDSFFFDGSHYLMTAINCYSSTAGTGGSGRGWVLEDGNYCTFQACGADDSYSIAFYISNSHFCAFLGCGNEGNTVGMYLTNCNGITIDVFYTLAKSNSVCAVQLDASATIEIRNLSSSHVSSAYGTYMVVVTGGSVNCTLSTGFMSDPWPSGLTDNTSAFDVIRHDGVMTHRAEIAGRLISINGANLPDPGITFNQSGLNAKRLLAIYQDTSDFFSGLGMDPSSIGLRLAGDPSGGAMCVDMGHYSSDGAYTWTSNAKVDQQGLLTARKGIVATNGYAKLNLPTSTAGQPSGVLWNDSGVVKVVP